MAQVTVDFNVDVTAGCGPTKVEFTDLSTAHGSSIVEWSWTANGEFMSSLADPGKVFSPGNYTICLSVKTSHRDEATACKSEVLTIHNLPSVDFAADIRQGCAPLNVVFTDKSSSSNMITSRVWDLGGDRGLLSGDSLRQVTGVYLLPDEYTVTLQVEDANGCRNSLTRDAYLNIGGFPEPQVEIAKPVGCGLPHTTIMAVSNADSSILYSWVLSDGQSLSGAAVQRVQIEQSGAYDLELVAIQPASGCRDTVLFPAAIKINPLLQPAGKYDSTCIHSKIDFVDLSDLTGGDYLWDFGDGNTSSQAEPSHRYLSPGNYTVQLTRLVDGCVFEETLTRDIHVTSRPELEVVFDKLAACSAPTTFTGQVKRAEHGAVQWKFGEEDWIRNTDSVIHVVDTFGSIPVRVLQKYLPGCHIQYMDTLYVTRLQATLPTQPISGGCAPVLIELEDSIQGDFSYLRREFTIYSDTVIQRKVNATIEIDRPGLYGVGMLVETVDGCIDSTFSPNLVRVGRRHSPKITADIRKSCAETTIFFDSDLSVAGIEASWDFGDGSESALVSPSHVYTDTGTFDVTLEIDHYGCISTDTALQYIEILGPVAAFGSELVCGLDEITLFDHSIAADHVTWRAFRDQQEVGSSTADTAMFPISVNGLYVVEISAENLATGCRDQHVDTFDLRQPQILIDTPDGRHCVPASIQIENYSTSVSAWNWTDTLIEFSDRAVAAPILYFNSAGHITSIDAQILDNRGCEVNVKVPVDILLNSLEFEAPSRFVSCAEFSYDLSTNVSSFLPSNYTWEWTLAGQTAVVSLVTATDSLQQGVHQLKAAVSDEFGCYAEVSLDSFLTIANPEVHLQLEPLTCPGQEVQMLAKAIYPDLELDWYIDNTFTMSGDSATAVFDVQGSYEICVRSPNIIGCSVMCDSLVVVSPYANFAADTLSAECPPLLVRFDNFESASIKYSWDFGDNSGISTTVDPGHLYTEPGSYDIELIASVGHVCADTLLLEDYIVIEGPTGEIEVVAADSCVPAQLVLSGISDKPYQYIWDFGDGTIDSSSTLTVQDTVFHTLERAGRFTPALILVDSDNCQRTLQSPDSLKLFEAIQLSLSAPESLCAGDSLIIEITTPKSLWTSVRWPTLDEVPCDSCRRVALPLERSGFLPYRTIDLYGCSIHDSIHVNVIAEELITAVGDTICGEQVARLEALGQANQFDWYNDSGLLVYSDSIGTAAIVPDISGQYYVVARQHICPDDTIFVDVLRHELPIINYRDQHTAYPGEEVEIAIDGPWDEAVIRWFDRQVSCSDCFEQKFLVDSTITLEFTVENRATACSTGGAVEIEVPSQCSPDFLYVPNVFSPNDDGINDVVGISTKKYNEILAWRIYDRWGNLVFQGQGLNSEWTGKDRGQALMPGVYVYQLEARCPIDQSILHISGDITLIR